MLSAGEVKLVDFCVTYSVCKMVSHHPATACLLYHIFIDFFPSCRAEGVYQSMKSVYGTHACHMLQINSVNNTGSNPLPNLPDPWSQFIIPTSEDTLVSFFIVVPADWTGLLSV